MYTSQQLAAITGPQGHLLTRSEVKEALLMPLPMQPRIYGVRSEGGQAGQVIRIPSTIWLRKYGWPEYVWANYTKPEQLLDVAVSEYRSESQVWADNWAAVMDRIS